MVHWLLLKQGVKQPMQGELMAWIKLYPPRKNFDMDNLMKALWDAMEHGGVYDNDNQIKFLVLEDTKVKGDFLEVYIGPRQKTIDSVGISPCLFCGRVLGHDTGTADSGSLDAAHKNGVC